MEILCKLKMMKINIVEVKKEKGGKMLDLDCQYKISKILKLSYSNWVQSQFIQDNKMVLMLRVVIL